VSKVKKLFLVIAVLAAAILPGAASAGPATTGTQWVAECRSRSPMQRIACWTYARGIADGITMAVPDDDQAGFACIGQEVQAAQLADVGRRFISKLPEYRHKPAGILLGLAFREAWPCETRSSAAPLPAAKPGVTEYLFGPGAKPAT
jgi:Rap1a immunity proteins